MNLFRLLMAVAAATLAPKPWPPIVAMVIFFSSMNLTMSSEISYSVIKMPTICAYFHVEGGVVVGAALVPVVKEPDVSDAGDFVVWTGEEGFEVLCGFDELGQPDHSGQIGLCSSDVSSTELNLVGVGDSGGLCMGKSC